MQEPQKKVKLQESYFGYSNESNPFNDRELNKKFQWGKNSAHQQLDAETLKSELDVVRRRRTEREKEKEKMQGSLIRQRSGCGSSSSGRR
jgi:hypothetical protein